MAELFTNNAQTMVAAGLSNVTSPVTFTVASAAAFPATGNFRIVVDSEILLVTEVIGSSFTATRAQESTAAAAHANGAVVTHVLTAAGLQQLIEEQGTSTIISAAIGDGSTNNTTVINAEITALSAAGGGVLAFRPGTYLASQIVLKRFVLLDGGHMAAVELKQIGGTNSDFIISENFAALTGSGHTVGTSALVPSWFGLKDIRIDGNGPVYGTNTSGRGIAWYGNAQIMKGIIRVHDTAGDAIYTENSASSAGDPWPTQEEGFFDTVIVSLPGGNGWLFRGPHNARINSYYCQLYNGSGYGFRNETTANTGGVTDEIGILHVYSIGTTKTGIYLGDGCCASLISADGCSIVLANTVEISTLACFAVDHVNMPPILCTVSGTAVAVGKALVGVLAGVDNTTCLLWSGREGQLGAAYIYGSAGSEVNNIGLQNTGLNNQFLNLEVLNFSGIGCIGVQQVSGLAFSRFQGVLANNRTSFHYDGGGGCRADLDIFSGSGHAPVGGATPTSLDRFDIRATGTGAGLTDTQIFAADVISLTTTTATAVNVAHGCLYTPTARQIHVTFQRSTFVYDWGWDIYPMVGAITAINVEIIYKLRTASATGGATGSISMAIRLGA